MTIQQAIRLWGYRARDAKRLEQVCRAAPKRFVRKGAVCIPEDCAPLYLPDSRFHRNGAVYAQLLNACVRRREVVPESLGLDEGEALAYLQLLELAGLLHLHNSGRNTTLRYLPTPKGEDYNSAANRTKRVLEAVKPLIPSLTATVQLSKEA